MLYVLRYEQLKISVTQEQVENFYAILYDLIGMSN